MNLYFHEKTEVNPTKLFHELASLSFKDKIDFYEITEKFILKANKVLTLDEELELKHLLDNHSLDYIAGDIGEVVDKAMEFGHKLLVNFSMENVILGITEAGLTEAVLDYLEPIKSAVQTGSLYLVITKIDRLIFEGIPTNLSPFVSVEKLVLLKGDINKYLGN